MRSEDFLDRFFIKKVNIKIARERANVTSAVYYEYRADMFV